jgi:hypothetical protein
MLMQSLLSYLASAPIGSIIEEFINPDGTYNINYVKQVLKDKRMTLTKFNQELQSAGLACVVQTNKAINEVSLHMFYKEYTFGKFLDTKGWIGHFASRYNKVLTKDALFQYLIPKHYMKLAYIEARKNEAAKKKIP